MAKILIAEDEKDIRELVTYALQWLGKHEVVQAVNGEDAVQKTQTEKPDLILLDGRMPRMSGYEACAELKKIEATKDIPIVFLSAKGQESEINEGLTAGAYAYILKPFAPDELVKQVQKFLEELNIG